MLTESIAPIRLMARKPAWGLAITPGGRIFFTEPRPGALYEIEADGDVQRLTDRLTRPRDVIAENEDHLLLLAERQPPEGGRLPRDAHRHGLLLRYELSTGRLTVLAENMKSPRGLSRAPDGTLFITAKGLWQPSEPCDGLHDDDDDIDDGPVGTVLRWTAAGGLDVVARGFRKPAGILVLADGSLRVVAERFGSGRDRLDGSVFAVAPSSGAVSVAVADDLKRPRGLARDALGRLFLSGERTPPVTPGPGVILQLTDGKPAVELAWKLEQPTGLAFLPDGGLLTADRGTELIVALGAPAAPALAASPASASGDTFTLTGTAAVGSRIVVLGGRERVEGAVSAAGAFSVVVPLVAGAEQALSVYAVGADGKALASLPAPLRILRDVTPPQITATQAPLPNANGWNATDVLVTFACSDEGAGVATCPAPVRVTAESQGQVVTGTAVDNAGNSAAASITVRIDKTPPAIAATLSAPANADGWHRQDVTVTFVCTDALSGLDTCPDPVTVSAEGGNRVVTGAAVDKAGNTASTSVTVRLDKTVPRVVHSVAPNANANGWQRSDVTVTFTCDDGDGAGVADCPSPVTVSTEGAEQPIEATATDRAGNTSTAHLLVSLDKTSPALTITSPPAGSTLRTSPVDVSGTVNDGLSGLGTVLCGTAPATVAGATFTCRATLVSGANTVAVTATDVAGNATSRSLDLTFDPNRTPTAQADGPYAGDVGDPVAFDGSSSSDPDGDPLTYRWDFGDGGTGIGRNATHAFSGVGTFTVKLTVDDGRGGSSTAETQAVLRAPNQKPTARIVVPAEGEAGVEITLDGGTSSDPDSDPLTYTWTFGDGTAATGVRVTHTYAAAGPVTVSLTVDDRRRNGAHATSARLTIRPRNTPPVASVGGPYSGFAGDPIELDASGSTDADQDPLTYRWSFGDGGVGTGPKPTHIYRTEGTFAVSVTVEDGLGGRDTKATEAVITRAPNRPPVAHAGGPYVAEAGEVIHFDGTHSRDPDPGDALGYIWDFGDGLPRVAIADGPTITYVYGAAGTYVVRLTVIDPHGLRDTAIAQVHVREALDRVPPVLALSGPGEALPGTTATVTASVSDNVGVASVRFEVDGRNVVDLATPPFEYAVALPSVVAPGTRIVVKATARDAAGNAAAAEWTIAVRAQPDTEVPTVTLRHPTEAAPGATIVLRADAADNVGVAAVTFFAGGQTVATDTQAPYEASYTIAPSTPAGTTLSFAARAADAAGNERESTGTLTVVDGSDTTAPTVTLRIPAEAASGEHVVLRADASDASGVLSVAFLVQGVAVATDSEPPYEADLTVPLTLRPGLSLRIEARARDFVGLEAGDVKSLAIVSRSATEGIVTGEVWSDASGLPIEGASVTLVGRDSSDAAYTQVATTDARGRYLLRASRGSAIVRIRKAAWTVSDRRISIDAGGVVEVIDARLTPHTVAAVTLAQAGGTVSGGGAELTVPAGALSEPVSFSVVAIGAQGLQGVLPLGWRPIAAIDVLPHGVTFSAPASLTAPSATVAGGTPLVVARWDEEAATWRAVGEVPASGPKATFDQASVTGQYAWLVPDVLPQAPVRPAIGEPVVGVDEAPLPPGATTAIHPNPRILFYRPGVKSDVTASVTVLDALPSGTRLLSQITESYQFIGGSSTHPEPFRQDLVFYQGVEASPLDARYPVTPSLSFDPAKLDKGVITVELLSRDAPAPKTVIGSSGGTVSLATGESLVVPTDALTQNVPVEIRAIGAADLGLTLPAAVELVAALSVSMGGAILADPAVLSVPRPASLPADSQVLLVRVQDVQGASRLVLVGWAKIVGDRLVSQSTLPINGTQMEGVRRDGRYLFLRATSAIGFVVGQVLSIEGAPFAGALVSTARFPTVSLSSSSGGYVAAAALGSSTFTALDLARSDSGSGVAVLGAAREETALDLRLKAQPPRVVSTVPADGAVNVPLSSPIVVTFSEPIDPASVSGANAGNLTVAGPDGVPVAGTLALSNGNVTLTLRPAAALKPDTVHTLTLASGIKDLSGNALSRSTAKFTSLDTTPPPKPPAGTVTAEIPNAQGETTIRASQGTAGPHDTVEIVNVTQGTSTPVLVNQDGSFVVVVPAQLRDKIQIQIKDAAGNITRVDAPRFAKENADGSVSTVVGGDGGTIQGPAGLALEVPAGAFSNPVVIVLRKLQLAELNFPLTPAQVEVMEPVDSVQVEIHGPAPRTYLNISFPSGAADGPDNQWVVAEIIDVAGQRIANMVDTAIYRDGRITTSSPPCAGLRRAAKLILFKAKQGIATLYSRVDSTTPLGTILTVATATAETAVLPVVAYLAEQLERAATLCVAVQSGTSFSVTLRNANTGAVIQRSIGQSLPTRGLQRLKNLGGVTAPPRIDFTRPPLDLTWPATIGNFDPAKEISVFFTKSMSPITVRNGITLWEDATNVPGTVALSDVDRVATFIPSQPLKFSKTYTLRLQSLEDQGGRPLAQSRVRGVDLGSPPEIRVRTVDLRILSQVTLGDLRQIIVHKARGMERSATAITHREKGGPQVVTLDITDAASPCIVSENSDALTYQKRAAYIPASLVTTGGLLVTSSLFHAIDAGVFPIRHSHVSFYDIPALPARPSNGWCGTTPIPASQLKGTKVVTTHSAEPPQVSRGTYPADQAYPRGVAIGRHSGRDLAYVAVTNAALMAVDIASNSPSVEPKDRALEPYVEGSFVDVVWMRDRVWAIEDRERRLYRFDSTLASTGLALALDSRSIPRRLLGVEGMPVVVDRNGNGEIETDEQKSDLLLIGGSSVIEVVDVTDPSQPRRLEIIQIEGTRDLAIERSGRRLYVAGRVAGAETVSVVDVGEPFGLGADRRMGAIQIPATINSVALDEARRVLFVSTFAGLTVVDVAGKECIGLPFDRLVTPSELNVRRGFHSKDDGLDFIIGQSGIGGQEVIAAASGSVESELSYRNESCANCTDRDAATLPASCPADCANVPAYGNHVRLEHQATAPGGRRYWTTYAHLEQGPPPTGNAGQRVGAEGTSGSAEGYHLHFSVAGRDRDAWGFRELGCRSLEDPELLCSSLPQGLVAILGTDVPRRPCTTDVQVMSAAIAPVCQGAISVVTSPQVVNVGQTFAVVVEGRPLGGGFVETDWDPEFAELVSRDFVGTTGGVRATVNLRAKQIGMLEISFAYECKSGLQEEVEVQRSIYVQIQP